jgi:hypothetical protein
MDFKKLFTPNRVLHLLAVAAPVVVGVIVGGVFTPATIASALGVIAAKLATSLSEDLASAKERKALAKDEERDSRGQVIDDEDPR